jgi:myo-inositol-1(or 4)-monophosphatase
MYLEKIGKHADTSAVSAKLAPNTSSNGDFDVSALAEPLTRLLRDVAAAELMPRFKRVAIERKHDGTVVTEADRAVEAALIEALPRIVDAPVLGEEMSVAAQRSLWHDAPLIWCVDPLDGTGNFAAGKRYFGISVALMRARRSVFGMVLDPNAQEVFYAGQHAGAYLMDQRDGHRSSKRLHAQPSVALSEAHLEIGRFKRLGRLQTALRAHPPCRKFSQSGASVLQWCHLAAALILEEAGGRIASLHHDDFWRANAPDTMWEQSVIAARHPALFDEWKRWVRQHY